MVTTIQGLRPAPSAPRAFGSESKPLYAPIRRGDEVRCLTEGREIYVQVLGVGSDGWLLGFVVMVAESAGPGLPDVRIGDLVEVRADSVWAFLRFEAEPWL